MVALAGYYVMATAGAVSLIWKMKMADVAMKSCAPIGAALTFIALVTGAIYAGIIGPTALFFCLVLPSIRFFIEAVAMSRLALSIFVFGAPEVGYKVLSSPMLTAALVVLGAAGISRVLHGKIHKAKSRGWRDASKTRQLPSRMPRLLAG